MSASIEQDICFDVDGTATHGTLRVPAHREGQRLAAALLLPGSGPVDRNGDVPGLNLTLRTLALIAGVLAELGIMSLRFDKYFTGRTGAGAYAGDPARIDLDAFIRQAAAAYHVLGARPEARPEALLVAGHSEGGLYALLTAAQTQPRPAGIALIEPMAEPLLSTIELQATAGLSAAVAAGTLHPAVAAGNASGVRRAIGEFRAGRPVDTSGLLPDVVRRLRPGLLVAENAWYVRQGDAVHPVAATAKVAPGTRVLVTAGTRDASIPVSAIKLLAVVLAGAFASDPGTVDLNAYIRQADYAYDYLIAQPGVDRQRMLVVGHSEGGFYAMLVADTVSTHPAGLALLEPQDQRILSLVVLQLDEQLNAAVQQGQLSASAAQQQAEGISNAIAQFRAGQQVETEGLLPQIVQQLTPELLTPGNAKVARTDDAVNPVDAAAKVAAGTRVLVTDGTTDTNIPVSTISPLASALKGAGTTGPELKVLTGVNHLLHEPGTADNDAVLAPSVVAALKAWAQPFAAAAENFIPNGLLTAPGSPRVLRPRGARSAVSETARTRLLR